MVLTHDILDWEIELDHDEIMYLLSAVQYMFPDLYESIFEMLSELKSKGVLL